MESRGSLGDGAKGRIKFQTTTDPKSEVGMVKIPNFTFEKTDPLYYLVVSHSHKRRKNGIL